MRRHVLGAARRSASRRCRRAGAASTPRSWRRRSRSSAGNPLVGLDGRAALLRRLGGALTRASPAIFGIVRRPGALFDRWSQRDARPSAAILCARCSIGSARSGRPAARWTACRSATPGAHPHAGGDGRDARPGAVPQALAVAQPTRCSSRSSGRASRSPERDALTGAARVSQRRPAARHGRAACRATPRACGAAAATVNSELIVEWRALDRQR